MDEAADELDQALVKLKAISDVTEAANNIRDVILRQNVACLRVACDEAETLPRQRNIGPSRHMISCSSE